MRIIEQKEQHDACADLTTYTKSVVKFSREKPAITATDKQWESHTTVQDYSLSLQASELDELIGYMPPKQRGGQPSKGQRLEQMARKKDERTMRAAHRKERRAQESYLADDENYIGFANQLAKMALQLRDIPGDGNCLFRALGDQLEGHGRSHLKHRIDVVDYMRSHRDDFEPFVEDDVPFEKHVGSLAKPGTYAGNDAIVAFARRHGLVVVIHQLNSPCWTIQGCDKPGARQLHISYHNGDHYSSVRKMGDNTESPASISISNTVQQNGMPQKLSKPGKSSSHTTKSNGSYHGYSNNGGGGGGYHGDGYPGNSYPGNSYPGSMYDSYSSGQSSFSGSYSSPHAQYYDEDSVSYNLGPEFEEPPSHKSNNLYNDEQVGMARAIRDTSDVVVDVMRETGCKDSSLVQQVLEENFYDVDAATVLVCHLMATSTATTNGYGGATPMFPSPGSNDSGIWSENGTASRIHGLAPESSSSGAKPKKTGSASRVKRDKKMEKKVRATERRRQQLLGEIPPPDYDDNYDDESTYTVTQNMGTLKI